MCLNNAGLTSGSQSDGVTLLFNKPNHQLATVSVLSPTLTWYESESGYLSSYSFQLIWNGFQDVSGAPLYYQVRIKENGTVLGEEEGWNNVGKLRQATLENVTVSKNILHMVEVRSYAVFGLMSEAVSEIFSIVPLAPTWNSKFYPFTHLLTIHMIQLPSIQPPICLSIHSCIFSFTQI